MINKVNLSLLVIVLCLTGCAGFRSANSSFMTQGDVSLAKQEKAKLYYKVFFDANMYLSAHSGTTKTFDSAFVTHVEQSNCCVIVADAKRADIQVRMTLSKYESPAALVPAAITGASMYTIPSWARSRYTYTAEVIDSNKMTYNYTSEDSWVLVQWLPMILLFPFKQPFVLEREIINDMHEDLLLKMQRDAVL